MGRKSTRNTRGRIISAAWKLFYQQGYEDTTVEDIVFESQTSKGSFYHYFDGKDALLGTLAYVFDEKYEELMLTMDPKMNAMDKLDEALAETPKVRADLGYPPLVTPSSQMVGVQAANNVLSGQRYKNITKEIKAYIRGEYGRAPGQLNPDLVKQVLGDEKPLECRFADTLEPGFEKAKKEIGDLARSDEDVLSYVAFPQIAEKFFREREEREHNTVTYQIRQVD